MKRAFLIPLISILAIGFCYSQSSIKLGVEVLEKDNFKILQGKRVGLVTNPTGVDSKLKSTVDILFESEDVNLVALFGPEHGVRGNFSAGDHVKNVVDDVTALPVYSLYGANRKPSGDDLQLIDVLVYDIQDIGVRSYTYISTLGLIMEAAAENNKEVVVLDRPNPLGGNRIEGPITEDNFISFISQFKIPYVYGLTSGEIALLINDEFLGPKNLKCKLTVVPMEGWKRNMVFEDTGLEWVPTSPHIPYASTAFYYATTGIIGEIDPNLIGIGYTLPFQTLVTENIDAHELAKRMNALEMSGITFRPIFLKPYYMQKKGTELQGVQIHITDFQEVNLTEIQFYFLQVAHSIDKEYNLFEGKKDRYRMFDLGCGTDSIRKHMMETPNFEEIKAFWNKDIDEFRKLSKKYYMYQ